MTHLTPHFAVEELVCRCGCGFGSTPDDYEPGFLDFLELLRVIVNRPITPNSGARCFDHNRAVGGVNLSAHTRGAAADLRASNGFERDQLLVGYVLARLVRAGTLTVADAILAFREISLIPAGVGIAKSFVHVDNDVHLPRPSAWGYAPNSQST